MTEISSQWIIVILCHLQGVSDGSSVFFFIIINLIHWEFRAHGRWIWQHCRPPALRYLCSIISGISTLLQGLAVTWRYRFSFQPPINTYCFSKLHYFYKLAVYTKWGSDHFCKVEMSFMRLGNPNQSKSMQVSLPFICVKPGSYTSHIAWSSKNPSSARSGCKSCCTSHR